MDTNSTNTTQLLCKSAYSKKLYVMFISLLLLTNIITLFYIFPNFNLEKNKKCDEYVGLTYAVWSLDTPNPGEEKTVCYNSIHNPPVR